MPKRFNGSVARTANHALVAAIVVAIQLSLAGTAHAQTAPGTDASLKALLEGSYEIKAMQYLPRSMVFTFQNESRAFVCETNLDGQSKLCVELE